MPTVKNLPWVSLALLLVTHSILGWQLSAFLLSGATAAWAVWLWTIVVGADLLLAAAISSPWSKLQDDFASLLKSDSRAFLVAVIFAFLSVVTITWLHIFIHILVVMCADILVRLETQSVKWSPKQSFWFLVIFSLAGLGLGALAQTLLAKWLEAGG